MWHWQRYTVCRRCYRVHFHFDGDLVIGIKLPGTRGTCSRECWPTHVAVNVREGGLALYDRIRRLIIRPLCVILHSLRHDLIPVLGLASALQSQHTLLPALPRWAPKSNREPFGAIKLRLIGEREPSGCLISSIFISRPTHHINLPCCVFSSCSQYTSGSTTSVIFTWLVYF